MLPTSKTIISLIIHEVLTKEHRMRHTALVGAFLVAAFPTLPLFAQNANVSGQVVDPQQATVGGATVTLTR